MDHANITPKFSKSIKYDKKQNHILLNHKFDRSEKSYRDIRDELKQQKSHAILSNKGGQDDSVFATYNRTVENYRKRENLESIKRELTPHVQGSLDMINS